MTLKRVICRPLVTICGEVLSRTKHSRFGKFFRSNLRLIVASHGRSLTILPRQPGLRRKAIDLTLSLTIIFRRDIDIKGLHL